MRLSLKTRDLQRAARKLTEIEDRVSGKPRKKIINAVASFRDQHESANGQSAKNGLEQKMLASLPRLQLPVTPVLSE